MSLGLNSIQNPHDLKPVLYTWVSQTVPQTSELFLSSISVVNILGSAVHTDSVAELNSAMAAQKQPEQAWLWSDKTL